MPKMKTRKRVSKRVKITGTGKIMRNRPMRGHLKSRKSSKRLRALRQPRVLSKSFTRSAKRMLGLA